MLKKLIIIGFLWITTVQSNNNSNAWTWVYHKHFNPIMRTMNGNKKNLFFEKNQINPFTQLVFSWNGMRPVQGYFSFYVQVRDAETKRWDIWHHMGDWGAGIQHSYIYKSEGFSSFFHVRLEIKDKKISDAFRIKIVPRHTASLSLIYNMTVSTSDFNKFCSEPPLRIDVESLYIEGLPLIAQFALEHEDNGRICSPVSCAMLVQYITQHYKDPLVFAAQSLDSGLGAYGSWPYNIAHAFEECNGAFNFSVRRMNNFAELYEYLGKGMPVIVSVRGNLAGALKPFPHGHLMVVVGWDNETKQVLCHDPAAMSNEKVFKRYTITDFLPAWERSHRLAYVAEPVNSIY